MKILYLVLFAFLISACNNNDAATDKAAQKASPETPEINANQPASENVPPSAISHGIIPPEAAKNDAADSRSTASPSSEQQTPQDYNLHSSMTSLDYFGVYLPEENSSAHGIKQITIGEDGNITVIMDSGDRFEGPYQWDVTGTTLHFDKDASTSLSFFVGENFLKRIDRGAGEVKTIFRKQIDQ